MFFWGFLPEQDILQYFFNMLQILKYIGMLGSDEEVDEVEEVADRVGLDTSDIYNLDVNSEKFKTLPQGHQYDILRYVQDTHKLMKGWWRLGR